MPPSMTFAAMSDALAGIAKLYVDSNIFIYLIEGEAELHGRVLAAVKNATSNKIALFTSELTLTECLHGAYRAGSDELAKAYLDLLATKEFVTLLPVDITICIEAARAAANQRLKTVDALHFATATASGCTALLTNDSGFRSTRDVRVVSLMEF
jgi:predicted nucleic acid-binding protein